MVILNEIEFKKEILKIVNLQMEGICEDIKVERETLRNYVLQLEERIKCLETQVKVPSVFDKYDAEEEEFREQCYKCKEKFSIEDLDNCKEGWICRWCEK